MALEKKLSVRKARAQRFSRRLLAPSTSSTVCTSLVTAPMIVASRRPDIRATFEFEGNGMYAFPAPHPVGCRERSMRYVWKWHRQPPEEGLATLVFLSDISGIGIPIPVDVRHLMRTT